MELDGYCRKLGLAFEYQGRQHYVDVDAFRKKSNLEERKKYDRLKRDLCVCNNVKLIVIPYTVQYEGIQGYILKECKEQGIDVPRITSIIDYRLFNVYSPEELRKLQHLAKSKGGMCLSKRYINSSTKLRWQCKKGHQWKTTPSNITNGAWCPHCYGHLTLAIGDMQRLAKEKGGKCLSTEYINSQTKLKWQCKKGHTWEAISTSIKNGNHWCPYCVGLARRTIEDMQNMAEQKGGECLSREYINSKVRLKWKCKEGHIWEATPNAIQRNQWCPHCAGTRKLSIEDMHKLAKNRGGECLSTEYINSKTKLKWQCKEGHRWWAKSNDIQTGYWCPYCAGSVKHTIEDMQRLAKKKKAVRLSTKYVNNKGSSLIFGG